MKEFLAGYISGARVDLARVREHAEQVEMRDHVSYQSRQFRDFGTILELYKKKHKREYAAACFGVAGPVIQNEVTTTNLPWHIIGKHIEKKFNIPHVKLINDIVATAHGLGRLPADRFFTINVGIKGHPGNVGLIAAGTGLGEALIYAENNHIHPYASEGGHADFAPGNQLETELWEFLYSESGQVEVEDVVSLRGLENIFTFLVDTQGAGRADWFDNVTDRPAAIIEKGLAGTDETAVRTLDMFIDCCASESANLALKGMTTGGIFLGGLIAPQIITALDKGRFMERFIKRGKMEALLAKMPIGVIIEENTALIGAGSVALTL
ncbi:MAG: glucokinase [candidate division Zixibacteria bacterium]|nr:glucokinase [candidate division Zixibacteria bacterium]